MMKQLRLAPDFTLPIDAVTAAIGIVAMRGVGKTYLSSVLIEEMLKHGQPVCIADPLGVWWGLRSSSDGKSPGFPIVVLGGEHGDLPLTEDMGVGVAQLVIEQRVPVVIDLKLFNKAQRVRFMTAFAEKLFHSNREPLHLVLDEADMFAPQKVFKGGERLLGAIDDIVRRGRTRGLGITMITQRPAVLNKDVLNMIDVLVALRLLAPQDRDAVDQWVKAKATPEQRKEFMDSLASLPIGTAWFWSPAWLDVFQKVAIRQRETFDSSKTPKVGEIQIKPRSLAEIDLTALQAQFAESIKEAESNDPKHLKKRVADLERQLSVKPKTAPAPEPVIQRVEVPVLQDGQLQRLEAVGKDAVSKGEQLMAFGREIQALVMKALSHGQSVKELSKSVEKGYRQAAVPVMRQRPVTISNFDRPVATVIFENGDGDEQPVKINAGARKMLAAMAQRHPTLLTRKQVAMLSHLSHKSGTFSNYLADLRRARFMVDQNGMMTITEAGFSFLGDDVPEQPQGTAALMAMWRGSLNLGAYRMLEAVVDCYPDGLTRTELAEAVDLSAKSGTYSNYLADLRRAGLLNEKGGVIYATDDLFLDGALDS